MDIGSISRRRLLRDAAGLALAGPALLAMPSPVAAAPAPMDARAKLFATGKLFKVTIDLSPENAEALRLKPREYVPAKVTDDAGIVYKDVGVHLRGGAGSFRPFNEKAGFTLKMDKFVDAQRFHGMEKFHLNNSPQDPSYLTELFCGELFRAAGVPAAKITHAVVLVNGKSKGLYVLKEGYDKVFRRNNFGDPDGNFYNGGFCSDIDKPLELLAGTGDTPPQEDLKAVVAAAGEANLTTRFDRLDKLVDMDKFLTFVAGEVICWHWDGYSLKANNYRVYQNVRPGKMVFIPSGMDQMFSDAGASIFPKFEGLVTRAVVETPEGRKRYLAKVAKMVREMLNPTAMAKWLDGLQARVQPAVAYAEPGAVKDYPGQVARVRNGARDRTKSLDEQLRKLRL